MDAFSADVRRFHSIARRLEPGLALLLQARRYAEELACDAWDFAVEIDTLRDAGLTNSDLRWLLCKQYVGHCVETFQRGRAAREFRTAGGLVFTKRSCFVLTDAGGQLLCLPVIDSPSRKFEIASNGHGPSRSEPNEWDERAIFLPPISAGRNGSGPSLLGAQPPPTADDRPHWDPDQRELHVGGLLVKQFKLPSPNQQMVLMAFEEEGWPPRIDDPLPPCSQIDPKRRLRDTIKSLNRKQKRCQLRFMGDGTGQGIRWSLVEQPDAHVADPKR